MADDSTTSMTLLTRLADPTDQEAWVIFVNRYTRRIMCWCRERGLSQQDCEDATQKILVKIVAIMREKKYDPSKRREGGFRAYLKKVANNVVSDDGRKKFRRADGPAVGGTDAWEMIRNAPDKPSLGDAILQTFDEEILQVALVRVEARCPGGIAVFKLRRDGHTHASIAEMLGLTCSAVGVRLMRVLKELSKEVKKLNGDEDD